MLNSHSLFKLANEFEHLTETLRTPEVLPTEKRPLVIDVVDSEGMGDYEKLCHQLASKLSNISLLAAEAEKIISSCDPFEIYPEATKRINYIKDLASEVKYEFAMLP